MVVGLGFVFLNFKEYQQFNIIFKIIKRIIYLV